MSWGDGIWGLGGWGGLGGIIGGMPIHITQQGLDQACRVPNEALRRQLEQRRAQRAFPEILELHEKEYQHQKLMEMIHQPYPLGSWPGSIWREIKKHLPSDDYFVFVQRRENRDAYMARITRGKDIVADVDVPNMLLRYPNRGEWRTRLCLDLARDIERRAG